LARASARGGGCWLGASGREGGRWRASERKRSSLLGASERKRRRSSTRERAQEKELVGSERAQKKEVVGARAQEKEVVGEREKEVVGALTSPSRARRCRKRRSMLAPSQVPPARSARASDGDCPSSRALPPGAPLSRPNCSRRAPPPRTLRFAALVPRSRGASGRAGERAGPAGAGEGAGGGP
jgi:hypothetical protein